MIKSLAEGWRVVDRLSKLSWADALCKATQDDSPTLEVRIRFEDGSYCVEVR